MAAKRRPDIQLTKDNFDQADRGGDGGDDDAEEYTGPMKVAAEEVLKNRTMVKAKRRLAVGGIGGGGGGGGGEDTANGLFSGLKSSFGSTPFGGGAAAAGGGGGSAAFTTKFTFGSGATAASSSSSASSAPAFSLPNSFSSTSSSKLTTSSLATKPSLFSGFSSSSSSSSSSATITSPSAAFAVPNSTLTSSKPLGASLFSNVNGGGGGTMVAGINSSNKPASTATPATQSSTLGDVPRLNKEFFEHLKKFMEPVPTVAYNFSNICQEYITQYQKLKEGYSDPPPQTSSSFSSSTSGQLATEQPLQTSATKATPFSFGLKETSKLNEVKPAAAVVSGGFGEKAATTTFATPAGPPKTSGLFKFGDIKGSDLTASASGFKLPSTASTPFTFGGGGGLSTSSSSTAATAAPVSFGSWPKSSSAATTTTTSSTSISSSSSATAPTLFGGGAGGNRENVTPFSAGAFATSTPLPKFGFQSAAASSMASAAGPTTFKLPSTTTTTSPETAAAAAGDTADAEGGAGGGTEEEDAPPKVASVEHNEADAVYRKKCRLYYQKEGNFVDKGLAFLYIKKAAGSRAQLLVRSDTTTGNILLNIALVESLPVSKAEKGKGVMLACIPNPPIEPPPKPKTGDDSGAASNGDAAAAAEEANKKSVTFLLRVKVSDSEELYDTIVRYQKEQS